MNTDSGYLFIYHFPLFPNMYVIDYVKTLYFVEKTCVYKNFVLDFVQKVENVDFVYTQLMNSDKVSIRIQIEINGIMFDLYRLHFTFDELYNELLNSNLIDKYWSIHYLILNDSQLMDDYQQQSIHPIDDLQYPLNKLNL